MNAYFLGIDVGSVSTNLVVTDETDRIVSKWYLRTAGRPIAALTLGMKLLREKLGEIPVAAVGTTGSGRQLADVVAGADLVKNEITAHAAAAQKVEPEVRTILEIGGQDSKIIFLRNGVVTDFAMNTVCAAGTGSFLDRQAARLNIPIERLGEYALRSETPTRIAGRCAVFAESDMIHKQQTGHSVEDIVRGLCEALVRNYLSNLAKCREIAEPVLFQGGVAANVGIAAAFERALGTKVIIPEYYDVMGAYGAALLARRSFEETGKETVFRGFGRMEQEYETRSTECGGCENRCEVVEVRGGGEILARWGDRCGKWSGRSVSAAARGC